MQRFFTLKDLLKFSFVCDCNIYNFDELNDKYNFKACNGSELLHFLLRLKGLHALDEIDGIYSLAFLEGKDVFLARDVIGLKPLYYSANDGLAFAFVKNELSHFKNVEELNPRKILKYDVKNGKVSFISKNFFSIKPDLKDPEEIIVDKLSSLFIESINKRIPNCKFGIMFSGGVDSTLIALVCKKLGFDFTCYTTYFSYPSIKEAEDFVYAKKVAHALNFKLKSIKVSLTKAEPVVKKLFGFLGPDAVKIGVALPEFFACEQAKTDGCKVVFSGLGSEELFAGYLRHKISKDTNRECLSGIMNMYDRDTYRDYIIAYLNNVKMETPFLDNELVAYALRIPPNLKLKDGVEKYVIRKVALRLGIPKEFAFRKKKAAQYGSNSDKILSKLARQNGFKYKADYLKSLI